MGFSADMIASSIKVPKGFHLDSEGKVACDKCNSTDISIIPKTFLTYYLCNNCHAEGRF